MIDEDAFLKKAVDVIEVNREYAQAYALISIAYSLRDIARYLEWKSMDV